MNESLPATPKPLFFGVADRVQRRGLSWDLMGLSTFLTLPFYPQSLSGLALVLAFPHDRASELTNTTIRMVPRSSPASMGTVSLSLKSQHLTADEMRDTITKDLNTPAESLNALVERGGLGIALSEEQSYSLVPLQAPPMMVTEPDTIDIFFDHNGASSHIGTLRLGFQQPAPIEEQERLDLLRRPGALVAAGIELGCKTCPDKLLVYSSLDKDKPINRLEPSISTSDAPSAWSCKCGSTKINLSYLKLGLHDLFRRADLLGNPGHSLGFIPVYKKVAIDGVLSRYQQLINSQPKEERVQEFLEKNELLWSFLSPIRIISKPPILTKKVADFAILSPNRTLHIVEIEKPQTQLLTKGSGQSHELQAGLNQINDWRIVVQRDWRTFLSELNFRDEEVHRVEFTLIAGLAYKYNGDQLRLLRTSFSDVRFMTFDELASRLKQAQRFMESA